MLVVVLDKLADLALEIGHRVKGSAADRLMGDQREPTLYLVEPGTVGRGEVQMKGGRRASQGRTLACLCVP